MDDATKVQDVFGLAMAMEEMSSRFYQVLSEATWNPQVKQFATQALADERRHYLAFRRLQLEWAATFRSAPLDGQSFAAWKAEVEQGAQMDLQQVARVVREDNGKSALAMAITREGRTVRFYEELIKAFPSHAEAIGAIIGEEDHHLEQLQNLAIDQAV